MSRAYVTATTRRGQETLARVFACLEVSQPQTSVQIGNRLEMNNDVVGLYLRLLAQRGLARHALSDRGWIRGWVRTEAAVPAVGA